MKKDPLHALIKAARKAHRPDISDAVETAPLGFATRVTTLARTQRPVSTLDLIERLGWRCAAVSLVISLVAVGLHMRQPAPNPFEPLLDPEVESIL